ncbi:3-isopropylmalate dehydrogenase [Gemmatimonas sp.]|jgi:3-isopropylmalate dehydrogenase|uniref:3-isopropylmalate dehydrogenase n=1 Tax=Gemmatimonas sp. TaxID=1962908 RepID=UPI0031BD3682|nr:3-isopropylmalate dehydrogenase [Gemmatimonas sp.]
MKARIAVLSGDGIGPEVTYEAVQLLSRVGALYGHEFVCEEALIGGAAIDATGDPLPRATQAVVSRADAVVLGAVGGPKWGTGTVRPEQGLLGLRALLGTFANVRPVTVLPALAELSPVRADRLAGTDLLFVRELTGGAYFGAKSREQGHNGQGIVATDAMVYSEAEITRVVRMAARFARGRSGRLTSVDKANVLETSRLWREVTTRVMRDEFPDVAVEHVLVDSFSMLLIQRPTAYDVVVTENLFGDILTDEAAVLAGSIGLLPSASLGERADGSVVGLYEPIHGSAPDIAGQGKANPVGALLSVALMLRHSFGLEKAADAVEATVYGVLNAGARTADLTTNGAFTTAAFGQLVRDRLA